MESTNGISPSVPYMSKNGEPKTLDLVSATPLNTAYKLVDDDHSGNGTFLLAPDRHALGKTGIPPAPFFVAPSVHHWILIRIDTDFSR